MTAFFAENLQRDYPFQPRYDSGTPQASVPLPSQTLVESSVIAGPLSQFVCGTHSVYLYQVRRQDPSLWLDFRSDAPGLSDRRLVFVVDTSSYKQFDPVWAEDIDITDPDPSVENWATPSPLPEGFHCQGPGCPSPELYGTVVLGDLSPLLAQVANGSSLMFLPTDWVLEPSRVQSLYQQLVHSFRLVNGPRKLVSPPPGCGNAPSSPGDQTVATCLQGHVSFVEGYNLSIAQRDYNNELVLRPQPGAGAGEPCQEVPRFSGETAQPGSRYLSGGPACDELVRLVNGKAGPHLAVTAGRGVRVYPDPVDANTLVIEARSDDLAMCPPGT